jgi:tRNA modification GTPase
MLLTTFTDTICALSTPAGTSAIASIRLSGMDALSIVTHIVDQPRKILSVLGGRSVYVRLLDTSGSIIDDGIVTVYRAPHSYTGEDLVEINPHGSMVIVEQLLEALRSHGARMAEPGEFSRRAVAHGKMSIERLEETLFRVESASPNLLHRSRELIHAKFVRLRDLYDKLIEALALVNAQIDFGDSDDIEVEGLDKILADLRSDVQQILSSSEQRLLNKGYITVSLVGKPNVGKSSLFNALLRYERSIVSETPGTTRDYIEAYVMISGCRVKLIDTAGIRQTADSIESRGVELGRSITEEADIILRITDHTDRGLAANEGEILIQNKSDVDSYRGENAVSSMTDSGLQALHSILINEIRKIENASSSFYIHRSEVSTLQRVRSKLDRIGVSTDLAEMAEDLKDSAEEIASISGLSIKDDTLNYIFQNMCIGK